MRQHHMITKHTKLEARNSRSASHLVLDGLRTLQVATVLGPPVAASGFTAFLPVPC